MALKDNLALYAVCVYAALLVLGAAGELFDVKWIQMLPLFRCP